MIYAQAGDVFFTRSSSLLGRLIRWAETDPREPNGVWANHVGIVVKSGWIIPSMYLSKVYDRLSKAVVVESLWKTQEWDWWENHKHEDGNEIRVYRKVDLNFEQITRIEQAARSFVGRTYGWWKLLAHLGDRLLFGGEKTLSHFLHIDSRPICSYTAAKSFAQAGVSFGMDPEVADPDEMMDWCEQSGEWQLVGSSRVEVK